MRAQRGRELPGFMNTHVFYSQVVKLVDDWRPAVENCRAEIVSSAQNVAALVASAVSKVFRFVVYFFGFDRFWIFCIVFALSHSFRIVFASLRIAFASLHIAFVSSLYRPCIAYASLTHRLRVAFASLSHRLCIASRLHRFRVSFAVRSH
jgi:hypothetical protein